VPSSASAGPGSRAASEIQALVAARVDVDVVDLLVPANGCDPDCHPPDTDRAYRPAMTPALAIEELRANAGTQFDARVVDALVLAVGSAPASLDGLAA
jgi:hypothetical protein